VCPTGALIDRQSAYHGLEKRLTRTQTTCVGCSVGCGIEALSTDNQLVRVEGNWNGPVNAGAMCKTGRFESTRDNRERLHQPLVRKNGKLEPATWDEALELITNTLKPLAGKAGSGIAAIASTRLPAESLSLFKQLFAGSLKSDMVTSMEEGWPTRLPAAVADELGTPFEANLEALKNADCVMVFGADLVEHHQVAGFFLKRALPKGVRLIVVDAEENGMDDMAVYALKITSGSHLNLIQAMQAAVAKAGMAKAAAPQMDVEQTLAGVSQATGLSAENISAAAQMLAAAASPMIVYGKNITHDDQTDTLKALIAFGKMVGASLLSVKGKANSLTASQYGLDRPFQLNGHQAAFVALGDELPSKRLTERLEKAPFLIVQASHRSPLTEKAAVVLPVATWAEQEGHYLNMEGRLQFAHQIMQPPQEVQSSQQVFQSLADRLGTPLQDNWKEQLYQRTSPVAIIEN
jgi:formate dehydrogenase major subunit